MYSSNLEVVRRLVMRSFLILTSSHVFTKEKFLKCWCTSPLSSHILMPQWYWWCLSLITNLDISTMPPSKDCLIEQIEQIKRANYQVRIWRLVNIAISDMPKPWEGDVWTINRFGVHRTKLCQQHLLTLWRDSTRCDDDDASGDIDDEGIIDLHDDNGGLYISNLYFWEHPKTCSVDMW